MSKKKLTRAEEFEIMKLVLDKFLWAGLLILLYGLFRILTEATLWVGLWIMIAGAIIMLVFMSILLREYEVLK